MPRGLVCRLWSVALSLLAVSAPASAWAAWAGGPWSPVVANPDPAHVIVEDVAYLSSGLALHPAESSSSSQVLFANREMIPPMLKAAPATSSAVEGSRIPRTASPLRGGW